MKKTKNLLTKTLKCLLVFGIIFSQLSFPLSVLADEVLENNKLNEVVEELENETTETNNGETTEGTDQIDATENDTENNITEENNPTQEDNTTSEDDNTTTEGDNSENIEEETPTPEEKAVFTLEKITQENNNFYIIKNFSDVAVTVQQLKELEVNAVITDEENNEITEKNVEIISNYQITITNEAGEEVIYTIIVLADYDNNGIVDTEDQTILLNQLKAGSEVEDILKLDLNKDEKFDILDVTYPIFTEKTWENEKQATDELTNKLTTDEEVVVGEEIKLNYIVEGFAIDKLAGIQGVLKYNKNLLQLRKIEVDGIEEKLVELENGNFAYLLADYNKDGEVLITLTFKALKADTEETVVSIEEIVTSIGGVTAKLNSNAVSTSFKISSGKGGDGGENSSQTTDTTTNLTETTPDPVVTPTTIVVPTVATTKYVSLSSDNYIKSLIITGYDIEFDKNTYEYSITVKSDVSSLDLTVLLNSDAATYYIEGNNNFKVGENIVKIVVTAENGTTRTYTIKVNKEKEEKVKEKDNEDDEEEVEEKSSTSKTIIIILIILVIIGLIYVIFKDDEEDEKESKKESKK